MDAENQYKIQIVPSVNEIDSQTWLNFISDADTLPNPFISPAFLTSLEDSGSATLETGWLGQHLMLLDEQDQLKGLLLCYLKNHSQGEYVFDHGWADAFERAGGRYYPKLQCSIPFTPATGKRLIVADDQNSDLYRSVLASGLKQLCSRHEVSSAHITFMQEHEASALGKLGFLTRTDQQFHWQNNDYENFDQFLQSLSSRKRKNIKKERQAAQSIPDTNIRWLTGDELTEDIWDRFFEFYMDTGSRKWGSPYLTREFFSLINERMNDQILLVMAERENSYIAGAINFIGDNCLYGRHWGCVEYHPALHFEICYYQAIEYAIQHGLKRVEAGAQGAHKLARGYMPVTTYSSHWIENPGLRDAISRYLQNEREYVRQEQEYLSEHSPFRKSHTPTDTE